MVEQTDACECHCHIVFIAGLDNIIVTDRTAWLRNKLYAAALCTLNVVAKREERIRAEGYAAESRQPCFLLFFCQRFGLCCEELLPNAVCQHVFIIIGNIDINGIVTVGSADVLSERKGKHFRTLTEIPDIRLIAGKTGAVNP